MDTVVFVEIELFDEDDVKQNQKLSKIWNESLMECTCDNHQRVHDVHELDPSKYQHCMIRKIASERGIESSNLNKMYGIFGQHNNESTVTWQQFLEDYYKVRFVQPLNWVILFENHRWVYLSDKISGFLKCGSETEIDIYTVVGIVRIPTSTNSDQGEVLSAQSSNSDSDFNENQDYHKGCVIDNAKELPLSKLSGSAFARLFSNAL